MNDLTRSMKKSAAIDATLDAPPSASDVFREKAGPAIAFVEGSGQGLSHQTQALLRFRLRAASMVLLAGFAVFLAWRLISGPSPDRPNTNLLVFFIAVTLSLGVTTLKLCVRCPMTLGRLRIAELAVFGFPAVFFVALQHTNLIYSARQGFLPQPAGAWFMLVFTYALFIPNTWRRAAVVLAVLSATPVIVTLVVAARNPEVGNLLTANHVVELALMMALCALTATYGTHMINALRREAFEAKQLGQYQLGEKIGEGGMGEVYLAEHQWLKRPCAIKLIRPERAGDPTALVRFEREVRATARLSHWNTVEIYDYGRAEDGTFYYVMEYLPGFTLATLVERFGPMAPQRVVHLLRQTCNGLREAHDMGLIHRDIKPGNIFTAERGGLYDVAKLLDFGLVKPRVAGSGPQVTQDGTFAGSPLFMAPEQALNDHKPDVRSDIYALGGVAYFLLTGQAPFNDTNPMKVLVAHARDRVVPPSQLNPEVPADLEQVILRCLAKKPEERFADVAGLERALAACDAADRWTQQDAVAWWQRVEQGSLEPAQRKTDPEIKPVEAQPGPETSVAPVYRL